MALVSARLTWVSLRKRRRRGASGPASPSSSSKLDALRGDLEIVRLLIVGAAARLDHADRPGDRLARRQLEEDEGVGEVAEAAPFEGALPDEDAGRLHDEDAGHAAHGEVLHQRVEVLVEPLRVARRGGEIAD